MRKYIYITIFGTLLASMMLLLTSCEKWLDVAPKTQIESDKVFEKESGFQDALTGIYVKLTSSNLYGRELTFGMVDGLAGQFNGLAPANDYYSTTQYDYDEEVFMDKSGNVFQDAYNAIANLNNLIANIEQRSPSFFTGAHYHTIKGEAYGLRAFVHFDMLRLYGSSIASNGESEKAIPYITTLGTLPQERLTTRQVLEHILADLEIAEEELAGADPIIPANESNATTYLRDRQLKFNYYATKALQARVYQYAGDMSKAMAAARTVLDSDVFAWTPSSEITASEDFRNTIFSQELIFSLHINGMRTQTSPYFDEEVSGSLLSKESYRYSAYFDENDYRFQYITKNVPSLGRRFSTKYLWNGGSAANRMPLIRKSELYYILAEGLYQDDPTAAIAQLNEVRSHRNQDPLPTTLSPSDIAAEMRLEYRREFVGEGQLFYYYKRKNSTTIDDVNITANEDIYVLPLPDREISFGL